MIEVVHQGNAGRCDLPRATFWIQSYNHAPFVAESIRSAFDQSSQPLEFVISDDCSTDGSFAVIRQVAVEYAGPARVMLYESGTNQDTPDHFSDVVALLSGDHVIWQSSDDIAHPDRAAALTRALAEGRHSFAWSNHDVVRADGARLGTHHPLDAAPTLTIEDFALGRHFDFSFGGTFAFTRADHMSFGRLPTDFGTRGLEHYVALRGALKDGCRYVPQSLLRKRQHETSLTIGWRSDDVERGFLWICRQKLSQRMVILANQHRQVTLSKSQGVGGRYRNLARQLMLQIGYAQHRLMALSTLTDDTATPAFDPSMLKLVGTTTGFNVCVYECVYFALPWALGPVEPCWLRNGNCEGVLCDFTLSGLMARLGNPHFEALA